MMFWAKRGSAMRCALQVLANVGHWFVHAIRGAKVPSARGRAVVTLKVFYVWCFCAEPEGAMACLPDVCMRTAG